MIEMFSGADFVRTPCCWRPQLLRGLLFIAINNTNMAPVRITKVRVTLMLFTYDSEMLFEKNKQIQLYIINLCIIYASVAIPLCR
jgi:hypothetical protein